MVPRGRRWARSTGLGGPTRSNSGERGSWTQPGAGGPSLVQVEGCLRGQERLLAPSLPLRSHIFHFCVNWGLILDSVLLSACYSCTDITLTWFRRSHRLWTEGGRGDWFGSRGGPGWRHQGGLGGGFLGCLTGFTDSAFWEDFVGRAPCSWGSVSLSWHSSPFPRRFRVYALHYLRFSNP